MIYVINLKKIWLPVLAALLFCLIAAIIIIRNSSSNSQYIETVADIKTSAPVLIIDAGHGGADGGAVSSNGIHESEVNLAISQKLQATAELFGIKTVMTRPSENIDYPKSADSISRKKVWDQKNRVELINTIENATLISIHQNKFPDSRPCGSQVLYASTAGSKELGELAHANLVSCLYPENRRVASPISDKIYLMKNVSCTAILVECGFLSNEAECSLLSDGVYQSKLAVVLLASYMQYKATF